MNKVDRFGTVVLKNSNINFVELKDSHPRRIETGIKAIANLKKTGNVDVMFQPIKRSIFSDIDSIIVSGKFKDIKKMFQEINLLLKQVGGNKAAAIVEYLQGNYAVSINTNEILKSLKRSIALIKK